MMSGQAFKRLHKAAAAGGWAAAAAAVLSRPSLRQEVAAWRARGSYQAGLRRCPHSLALWQLAGALEMRGAHRSSSGTCCFVLLHPLTNGTWQMVTNYTAACATNKR